jgi:SAM-dependent methyltransferase
VIDSNIDHIVRERSLAVSEGVSEIVEAVGRAMLGSSCHRVVLSRRRGDRSELAERVVVRPVELADGPRYQFTSETQRQQTHENLEPAAAVVRIGEWFPECYGDLHLFETREDLSARVGRGGRLKVHRKPATTLPPESSSHDRTKQHLLPDGQRCAFLEAIGVMTSEGRVKASRQAKFRQVNRFLELVDDCVGSLPEAGDLQVVDFGCGKSYLTFALYHLLTELRGREVRIVGIERESEVVEDCRGVAQRLGWDDIEFHQGEIADFPRDVFAEGGVGNETRVDLAVSLHACDTATDDALARAVGWQAGVILAVPCCQHELAGGLAIEGLSSLHRHGILHERLSALVTDALRAEALEVCGYRTGVIEFIDMEHTAKNVLLRGVRREPGEADERRRRERAETYRGLRGMLELETFRLEEQLEAELGGEFAERISGSPPPQTNPSSPPETSIDGSP